MVGCFDRLSDKGESVVLDLSTVHTHGPPSLPGKDKNIVSPLHPQSLLQLPVNILLYPLKIPPYFPIWDPDDFIS